MFDGTSFRVKEFEAWMNSEPKGSRLKLKCEDADLARNRVLYYARQGEHEIKTTKLSDTIITIELIYF